MMPGMFMSLRPAVPIETDRSVRNFDAVDLHRRADGSRLAELFCDSLEGLGGNGGDFLDPLGAIFRGARFDQLECRPHLLSLDFGLAFEHRVFDSSIVENFDATVALIEDERLSGRRIAHELSRGGGQIS